jgi:hypothetical protein
MIRSPSAYRREQARAGTPAPSWYSSDPARQQARAERSARQGLPSLDVNWEAWTGRAESPLPPDDHRLPDDGWPDQPLERGDLQLLRQRKARLKQKRTPQVKTPEISATSGNPYLMTEPEPPLHEDQRPHRQRVQAPEQESWLSRQRNAVIGRYSGQVRALPAAGPVDEGSPYDDRPYSFRTYCAKIGLQSGTVKDAMRLGNLPRLGVKGKPRAGFGGHGGRTPVWYGDDEVAAARRILGKEHQEEG